MSSHIQLDNTDPMRTMQEILDNQIDVTGANHVEVSHSDNGSVLWVNVDGVCLLRICRIRHLCVENVHIR